MWYIPTVRMPASLGPAWSPIVKKAMSWWLDESGATHEDVLPVGIVDDRAEPEHVGVEALLATGVADVEHRMVHSCDPHRASLLFCI